MGNEVSPVAALLERTVCVPHEENGGHQEEVHAAVDSLQERLSSCLSELDLLIEGHFRSRLLDNLLSSRSDLVLLNRGNRHLRNLSIHK